MLGSGSAVGELPQAQPSAEEVRAQLERLVASPDLDVPPRARRFLRYVIEETLAGRAGRIKAYAIGTEVFGRDASFDAQSDPVVRIEAGRLRRALEHYYLVAGQADPVVISIPKGGYVPHFASHIPQAEDPPAPGAPPAENSVMSLAPRRWAWLSAGTVVLLATLVGLVLWRTTQDVLQSPSPASATLPPEEPTLVVMPFANLGELPEARIYADGLTEEVLSQLARFKEITVLGRETSRTIPPEADLARIRRELGARYVLEGSIRAAANHLRVTGRLLETETGVVLWSQDYDEDLRIRDFFAIQDDIAEKVATAVGQPYGIIFRADEKRVQATTAPDDLEAYACTLQFYGYRTALSAEKHAATRICLERAVGRYPSYATAWAMLSVLYLDEDRFGFNPRPGSPGATQRAIDAARRAIRLDPENVRALQALMLALFFTGQPAEALRIGEQAVALNPNDTELLADFASRLGQIGAWDRGATLLEQALARNPGHSDYYNGMLAVHAYMKRDYRRAETLIHQVSLEKFPLYHFIAAIIYAQLGMTREADEAREQFLRMRPTIFDHWDEELAKRNFRSEDAVHLAEGARKAGFPVPDRTAAERALEPISR
ncbi:tetratricopeptide repeat protein [Microvirga massiliensis]|uniref:tetratricopeptide repeat protein n=1 Tax=Microvirga massiliensis TaxID=1033741 RepID=UPI00062BA6DF|nr:tetratricopeptide repeat protein [Microvirga massiliensis]